MTGSPSASVGNTDDPETIATAIIARELNSEGAVTPDMMQLTEDADLINAAGPHWHGREEIAANVSGVMGRFKPKASSELVSATLIAPGLILAISKGAVTIPASQPGAGTYRLMQSRILVKQGDVWKTRFTQSTPIVQLPGGGQ